MTSTVTLESKQADVHLPMSNQKPVATGKLFDQIPPLDQTRKHCTKVTKYVSTGRDFQTRNAKICAGCWNLAMDPAGEA